MLKSPNDNFQFNIDQFYKQYLQGPKIFKNRDALEASFIPNELPHRDKEIERVAELTACALNYQAPSHFLCYGMTGTGKTATIRYVSQKLSQHCSEQKPWWIYINCNIVSTPYRILAHICNDIARKEVALQKSEMNFVPHALEEPTKLLYGCLITVVTGMRGKWAKVEHV